MSNFENFVVAKYFEVIKLALINFIAQPNDYSAHLNFEVNGLTSGLDEACHNNHLLQGLWKKKPYENNIWQINFPWMRGRGAPVWGKVFFSNKQNSNCFFLETGQIESQRSNNKHVFQTIESERENSNFFVVFDHFVDEKLLKKLFSICLR